MLPGRQLLPHAHGLARGRGLAAAWSPAGGGGCPPAPSLPGPGPGDLGKEPAADPPPPKPLAAASWQRDLLSDLVAGQSESGSVQPQGSGSHSGGAWGRHSWVGLASTRRLAAFQGSPGSLLSSFKQLMS